MSKANEQAAKDNKQITLISLLLDNIDPNHQPRWRIIDMNAGVESIMNMEDVIEFYANAEVKFVVSLITELLNCTPEENTYVGHEWIAKRLP